MPIAPNYIESDLLMGHGHSLENIALDQGLANYVPQIKSRLPNSNKYFIGTASYPSSWWICMDALMSQQQSSIVVTEGYTAHRT